MSRSESTEDASPAKDASPGSRTARLVRRLGALCPDLTPLRTSRDFRLLWIAGTIFYLGGMVTYVALPYQIYQLTGSNFAIGLLGLVQLVPLIVCGLYGGVLADRVDRKRVLVVTGAAQCVLIGLLLVNAALPDPQIWPIYALGALLTVTQSLQRPSREALTPRVVRHEEVPAAVVLSSIGLQVGMLAGPALGGVLTAKVGVAWAYAIDVAGLLLSTALFAALRPYPPLTDSGQAGLGSAIREIAEGMRYAVRRKDLLGTYVVDMTAMVLAMPVVLFPALASDVFHQPAALGLLYSASTVGSLVATATSGWTSRVHHHGRAVVLAAAAWGAAVALAGLAPSVWLAVAAFVMAGAADMISGLFRSVIWNQTIPDDRRGRLAGIEMLSYSIGPLAGEARAGLVADMTSVRASIVSGGALCVVGVGLVARWLREFWRYDARTDEHAVRERERRAALAAQTATSDVHGGGSDAPPDAREASPHDGAAASLTSSGRH
ncbi:MFS transporter [Thermasporomyces composti]|uniref:Putative MFS family arabinose efflux permease n=1 Tax=Thermasporomyces composti TaxID=696763 RepID=A0A3D9V8T5_THECX|nr:putative MFS family arabinose efflux permease [Thermasporomyces composti]